MLEKLKIAARWMHDRGIPLPLIRDTNQQPSVSLTMMIISFVFCLIGLFQKLNSTGLDVDVSQALTLLGITSALYFGRRVSESGKSSEPAVSTDIQTKE